MANCDFLGVAKVSGTLSKTKLQTKDGIITRRVVACVRNGKQRIYFREDKPGASSRRNGKSGLRLEGPMATNRLNFGTIAAEVSRRMANGDKRPRKVIWAEVKAEQQKGGLPCS